MAFGDWLLAGIYLVVAISIGGVVKVLWSNKTGWSLANALSEEVDFTLPSGGKETRLVASTSRLIALFGLIVLLAMYLAVGAVVIVKFAAGQEVPNLTDVYHFFLAGAGLFVPYTINQVRSAFDFLGK
ncbi:MAG: hypothetical protein ACHQK9_07400 [Reyranellales bacterium]